jgi:hypothetical protein
MDRAAEMTTGGAAMTANRTARIVLPIFAIAVIARFGLAFFAPVITPDSVTYLTVAQNIRENGCVSLSPPSTAECKPDWGGNQLPGYPLLLAIGGGSIHGRNFGGLAAQNLLVSFSIAFFVFALVQWNMRTSAVVASGLVLALSPLTLLWSRWVLTESLALASYLCVIAELIRCETRGRLRVFPIATLLGISLFVRYDTLLLALPVLVVAVHLHGPVRGMLRAGIATCAALVPLGIWVVRCVSVGLPALPSAISMAPSELPKGTIEFYQSWALTQSDLRDFLWPVLDGNYRQMRVRLDQFDDDDRQSIEKLMQQLAQQEHAPISRDVDDQLHVIAARWKRNHRFATYLSIPALRSYNLWRQRDYLSTSGWPGRAPRPLLEAIHAYSLLLLGAALFLLVELRRHRKLTLLLAIVLITVVTRTIFFAVMAFLEVRYLVPTFGLLEAATAIGIAQAFRSRRAVTAEQLGS